MAKPMTGPAMRMSVMDAIYERRSVRSYLPERLDRDTIRALLVRTRQVASHERVI